MANSKVAMWIGLSASCLFGFVGPGRAQTTPLGPGPAGASTETQSVLEDIVVTARKREERSIDVPVAVTEVGPKTLDAYNARDLGDIGNLVPGVSFERTAGGSSGATLTIRGVGNLASDYGNEQPVAVNVDGLQITKGHVADLGFFDLASVQVLKGPQSLFFGKNSPAGVVALDSVTPGSQFEGYMRATYEFSQETPALEGAVSIPLTDTLSMRIAARYTDQLRGQFTNYAQAAPDTFDAGGLTLPGAAHRYGPDARDGIARITLAWKPTSDFDATLKFLWNDYRDDGGAAAQEVFTCSGNVHPTTTNILNPAQALQDPFGNCHANYGTSDGNAPASILQHFFGGPSNGEPFSHTSTLLSSLKLNWTLPDVVLTSVSGFYDSAEGAYDNYDLTVYGQALDAQHDRDKQYSQEFRAASTYSGPLNYTVGAYYEYDHHTVGDTDKIAPLGPYPVAGPYFGVQNTLAAESEDISKNYSFFGQLSWKILENLELAGGARWSHDDRSATVGNVFNHFDAITSVADNPFSPAGVNYSPHITETNTSPEVTLTYHPVHDLTIYGAFKTGYLSGGIANPANVSNFTQLADPNAPLIYGQEKVRGGEVGIKGLFFDGRARGDLTFFDYKYTDLQVETYDAQTLSYQIRNAGSSTDKGIELQGQFSFDSHLSTHGSLELIDLEFGSYPNAQCYPGQTVAQGCLNAGLANASQDLGGTHYGDSPVVVNLGLAYDRAFNDYLSYTVSGDAYYNSRAPDYERDAYAVTPAYTLINASLGVYHPGSAWTFHLIGTNLSGAMYYKNFLFKPLGANGDISAESFAPPRAFTLEADYKF